MNLARALSSKKQLRSFADLGRKTHRRASYSHVHSLRVLTRRLAAPYWLLKSETSSGSLLAAEKRLRKLRKVLGKKREWDVALKDAEKYGLDARRFAAEDRKFKKRVARALKAKKLEKVTESVKKAVANLRSEPDQVFVDPLHRLRAELLRASHQFPATHATRHRLRVRLKIAKYILEALGQELPELTELISHLGRERDLFILQQIFGRNSAVRRDELEERYLADEIMKGVLQATVRALAKVIRELSN